ncbi:MAG: 3-oxoacyl-ACP reductase FabG [Clostridia bacterium]|nr:3-oxoacyl-ACP reductase FabG [Clostridia bacterium]
MRKIIVTGGSRGIGAAVVQRFAESGDRVVFFYRANAEAAAKIAESTGAYAIKCDISSSEDAARGMDEAIRHLGGLDVLVNCAGVAQIKLFTDIEDADWRRMLDTDLSGAFYTCRAAAREMIRSKNGRIINIGSVWGRVGASCEVHYSAAKSGLRGLTLALAKELGPSGITVNCVEPGVIETEMNAILDEKTKSELADETPLCRMGEPREVAEAVFFLAGEGAAFITGQCLGVDGGFGL